MATVHATFDIGLVAFDEWTVVAIGSLMERHRICYKYRPVTKGRVHPDSVSGTTNEAELLRSYWRDINRAKFGLYFNTN
jgi:hypothetical protein